MRINDPRFGEQLKGEKEKEKDQGKLELISLRKSIKKLEEINDGHENLCKFTKLNYEN